MPMASWLAALLLLPIALGCADARLHPASASSGEPLAAAAGGRALLQVTQNLTECSSLVAHCEVCRYQYFRGTRTKTICNWCENGYVSRDSGRACWCAPGFYTTNDTNVGGEVGFTCLPCGFGYYCPGAKLTAASSVTRFKCGVNKVTTTDIGRTSRECVVMPGYGWFQGDASAPCPQGFYNPGYNTRKCTKCRGALSTAAPFANSSASCVAPPGYYFQRGNAVLCARGTYKGDYGNTDCDKCPAGMTTPANAAGQTDEASCNVLLPGYSLDANPILGYTAAQECGPDAYRTGEVTVTAASGAVDCTPCGAGMVTGPNVTTADTPDACLVAPGYGWVAPTSGNDTKGSAVQCPLGWYNPGYNREPCIPCGNGTITTEGAGATGPGDCFTPAGHGTRRDVITGALEGYVCPLNTYGRATATYDLVDVRCTECPDNTHTVSVGSTDGSQCLTNTGYGWDNGLVAQCDYGYYNPGGNQNKCTYCGDFFNTTIAATSAAGERGSDSGADCKHDLGYQAGKVPNTIEACLQGWYKDVVGNVSCTQCPAGTSTTITMAAVARSDCDVCRPGFGVAGGAIDLAHPSCSVCQSGTYSPGFTRGGEACVACPQARNFSGEMVSRRGASAASDCAGEFISDDTNFDNYLWWDVIPMNDSPTFIYKPALRTLQACQSACGIDAKCQYFGFYAQRSPNGVDNACFWRQLSGVTPLSARIGGNKDAAWWDSPTGIAGIAMFEIGEGSYVVYPKTATEVIGYTLFLGESTTDFKAMRAACEKAPTCIGLTWDAATQWRAFEAVRLEEAVGKVRVVGNAINSWVAVPSGTEDLEGWNMG